MRPVVGAASHFSDIIAELLVNFSLLTTGQKNGPHEAAQVSTGSRPTERKRWGTHPCDSWRN